MTWTTSELITCLYAALHSERGVEVECSPSASFIRQKLYALRKEDPALEILSFHLSPKDEKKMLWITKRV
jgi:hypothetical protein